MLRWILGIAVLLAALPACSLGNVAHDDCKSDAECVTAFGRGSACQSGYCTAPSECESVRVDGVPCYACTPQTPTDVLNACTGAACVPFDNKRVTKLVGGELPPLPAP